MKLKSSTTLLLQEALKKHQRGEIQQAAAGYRAILEREPKHCDALHLLGVAAQQLNQLELSIQLIQAAIAQNASVAYFHNNLANSYLQNNQPKEALNSYLAALRLDPKYAEAHNGMGNALILLQNEELAVEAYRKAAQCNPNFSTAFFNLGKTLTSRGNYQEAVKAYVSAIQLEPQRFEFHNSLGRVLFHLEHFAEATSAFHRAAELNPSDIENLKNLAIALEKNGQLEESEKVHLLVIQANAENPQHSIDYGNFLLARKSYNEACVQFERAIQLAPELADSYFYLGISQLALQRTTAAERSFRKALSFDDSITPAWFNLGNILREELQTEEASKCYRRAAESSNAKYRFQALCNLALCCYEMEEFDEAINLFRSALSLEPENHPVRVNLAYSLMAIGKLQEGFSEYECRFNLPEVVLPRELKMPRWKGEALNGEKIYIYWEQGFGDTIQFIRYIPLVAERGGRVLLDVQTPLYRLLKQVPGIDRFIQPGESFDDAKWHCPLLSLPLVFGTTIDTIPCASSYLKVDKSLIEESRVNYPSHRMRIGLVWRGRPTHVNNTQRSMKLRDFEPLFSLPNMSFFSLQVEDIEEEKNQSGLPIVDAGRSFTDYMDTAAMLSGLDLVITIDTSVAHLAGALGIPVWILLPKRGIDWRWFYSRNDSPWYPSARLFRQTEAGNWKKVISEVQAELEMLTTGIKAL